MKLKDASWNKSYDKQTARDISLPTKVPIVKTMAFPVVMWDLNHKKGWALKNWCFRTLVLERLLRVPWTAGRSNQSILKKINPEYSLDGLMLKLQYSDYLIQRVNSLEKTLMLGKIEGRRKGWQRMRGLGSINDLTDMSLSKLWEIVKDREAWRAAVHGVVKRQTQLRDWTTRDFPSGPVVTIPCSQCSPLSVFSTLSVIDIAPSHSPNKRSDADRASFIFPAQQQWNPRIQEDKW